MIGIDEAAAVQEEVALAFGEPAGIVDHAALARALARPFATENGIPRYPAFLNKVSILLQGLLDAKPFAGANRRTAIVIAALLLEERGYRLQADVKDVERLMVGLELGFTSWHRTTAWLKGRVERVRPLPPAPGGGASEAPR